MNTEDIGAILLSLSESGLIDNKDLFETIKHIDGVVCAVKYVEEMDYESLYYLFAYRLEQTIDGMVEHVTPSYDAKLIFKHSHFIETHLSNLFEKREGSACCADKARTIIRSLLRFYMAGKKIEFDYGAEYTYHLPKTMLKDHDSIVMFVNALIDLYYGNPEHYLNSLLTVAAGTMKLDDSHKKPTKP